jgi:LmbE family N-acetylglucosaminyl deacetylase
MTGTGARPGRANPIDAPGTSETAWSRWPGLSRSPVLNAAAWTSAVILAAHPDDEVLGVGGVISLLADAGSRLRLVAVTDGEASHPGHSDPPALARRRAHERARALLALGAADAEVIRLGLPDSGLAGREGDIAAAIENLVTGFDACLAPWEDDVHADHEAVGRAARQAAARAARQTTPRADHQTTLAASRPTPPAARQTAPRAAPQSFFYPLWMWHWARPADPRVPWRQAVRVTLPPAVADRKRAAIDCFGSQQERRARGTGPVLPPGFVSHFSRDYEVLFPVVRP